MGLHPKEVMELSSCDTRGELTPIKAGKEFRRNSVEKQNGFAVTWAAV